jgi:hypothetical protein
MSSLTPDNMVGPMKLPSSYPATDTPRPSRSNVTPAFSEASKILRMRSSASLLMMGPVHSFLAVSSSRQSLLLVRLLLVSRFFSSDCFSSEICMPSLPSVLLVRFLLVSRFLSLRRRGCRHFTQFTYFTGTEVQILTQLGEQAVA